MRVRKNQTELSPFANSPASEEGNDGKGRVVGVREDVLEEEVWLAAVLQGQGANSISNINFT